MDTRTCTCCGRPLPDAVDTALKRSGVWLNGPFGRVLLRLARSAGDFVPYSTLVDAAYGTSPDGGPLTGWKSVVVSRSRYRQRLADAGLRVETQTDFGWRLVWTDNAARLMEAA